MKRLILLAVSGFRALPLSVAVTLGKGVGWLLYYVLRYRRKIVEEQMQMAYGDRFSPAQMRACVRGHYRHLGLLFVEMLRLPGACHDNLEDRLLLHGREHLDAALAAGRGVMIIGGHFGNWELCGIGIARSGYPVTAIGKELKSEMGEFLKTLIRDENGVPTIPRRNSIRQILKAIKSNAPVVFMIDQNIKADEGIFVDFFGHPACTMTAAAVIAERTGATVLPVCAWRDEDHRTHHCQVLPAFDLAGGPEDRDERVRYFTQLFNRKLEEMVTAHPEQWMWLHKRWRTRPPDEATPPIVYRRSRKSRKRRMRQATR